ncbi:hypothetical protein FOXG_19076 [Fusarium oxysporum f. sp. lycopersici 4287]|uniref:Uncharacterized protein n=2 Tax=Fusarium oxysporum TaxID=5507 RepID=A0A0J9UVI1_FUSO4|nr:hypothetical protein FOXG_19076 [Fusarium oxysporum f. sp. lycopersici 4287]EXK39833.1 hypothetical protein FOMG_06963 [Fusarium oxysporum f. sp. melonis 26406]KNB02878.1 hypothetical protein FOXG_19076 [Fusarium oxysporum f. sp. lycopersici 4287]
MADTETLIGATNRNRGASGSTPEKEIFSAAHLCRYQTNIGGTVLL